jgi:hypothetical protein
MPRFFFSYISDREVVKADSECADSTLKSRAYPAESSSWSLGFSSTVFNIDGAGFLIYRSIDIDIFLVEIGD